MGFIVQEAKTKIEQEFPDQLEMLKVFLSCFNVTYADKKQAYNTTIYAYILKPEASVVEGFGFDREILLVYSAYEELQARAFQAINWIFGVFPFRNRVDSLNCFVVSKDNEILKHRGITSFEGYQSRFIIPLSYADLINNKDDAWYIRNILRMNCFDVDLFGYMLPLREESSFFGRQQIIARYIDAIKRCENKGIYGVRKTGKTSLLFKIDRIIREQRLGFVFYYDCKSPSYRKLHWNEFLGEICSNIAKRLKVFIRREYDEQNIIKTLRFVMKKASEQNKRIVIMFDEIEYISFKSQLDSHWHTEFIDFWQTIWSVQSVHRNLVFILSGVNPSVTEIDTIHGIQNPLFSIVHSEYLHGLDIEDAKVMIHTLGRRMGLKFDREAMVKLYDQFNGHPLLLRLACSYINRQYSQSDRPVIISEASIRRFLGDIDQELAFYFKHIVTEIQQFYPEEYEMFELLASGQTTDFVELSSGMEFTKHLYDYGLVAKNEANMPYVKLPVAGRYVALELAKKEHRKTLYRIVDINEREKWVKQRIQMIVRDIRQLEIAIQAGQKLKLYGENSFPEADRFVALGVVSSAASFSEFFNICSRCFVEPIENYGAAMGKNNYFWADIQQAYPSLFPVLERIKVYRNGEDHSKLYPAVAQKFIMYREQDTEGVTDPAEQRFCIQQRILENFVAAIQTEIEMLT